MDKINPIKVLMALRALDKNWKEDVISRTREAMKALMVDSKINENTGNGDSAGYADITVSLAVCTNILSSIILSIYDHGKDPEAAGYSLLAIIDTLSRECKKQGFDFNMVDLSNINDTVEKMKKSAGFSK